MLEKNPYMNKTSKITPQKTKIYRLVTKRADGHCENCNTRVRGERHHILGRNVKETAENVLLLGGNFDLCQCHNDHVKEKYLKECLQNYYIDKYGEEDARLRMGGSLVKCNHHRMPWWFGVGL